MTSVLYFQVSQASLSRAHCKKVLLAGEKLHLLTGKVFGFKLLELFGQGFIFG